MPSPNFFYSYARRYEPQADDTNTHTHKHRCYLHIHTHTHKNGTTLVFST